MKGVKRHQKLPFFLTFLLKNTPFILHFKNGGKKLRKSLFDKEN